MSEYNSVSNPVVGEKYHTTWARKIGMVWRCIEIQETTVTLQTPKTKKIIPGVKKSDLLHIRKNNWKK